MIAVIGAGGPAVHRLDRCRQEARKRNARFLEPTPPDAPVRLAVLTGGPEGALDLATEQGVVAVAIGSGLAIAAEGYARRLARAYLRDRTGFLERELPGEPHDLAVVIADADEGRIILGTTPGSHRLFIWESGDEIVFSSQLTVMTQALGPDLRLDRSYEDFLLGFGFLPDGRTPYRGIRSLPGAALREWPGSRVVPVSHRAVESGGPPTDAGTARKRLHDTFLRVLEDQAGDRRRHAVLLGGFDSALVAAGLRRLGHEVDTYTFSFGDPRYEQRDAELIATTLGARHHEVNLTPEVVGDALARFSEIFNQPAPQPHYQIHTAHAARVIATDGHDHVFTGDGCDSVFLGYPTVSLRSRVLERVSRLPHFVRRGLFEAASAGPADRWLGHVARTIRSTLASVELDWPANAHLPTQYLDAVALRRLRRGDAPEQAEEVAEIRARLAQGLDDLEPIRIAFHGNGLVGQSGSKVEGSVAYSGISQMSPYRDARLEALVRKLPLELLRPSGSTPGSPGKKILYDMVREQDLLPQFVLDLPKQSPSDSPIDRWYAGPLRPLVDRLLEALPFQPDLEYVEEILASKRAEEVFRNRISLGHHAFQAIGLLCSYASFTGRAR